MSYDFTAVAFLSDHRYYLLTQQPAGSIGRVGLAQPCGRSPRYSDFSYVQPPRDGDGIIRGEVDGCFIVNMGGAV